jgi:hypothetical protein
MMHKYLMTVVSTSLLFVNAFTQPVLGPQRSIGGSSDDILINMSFTKDGGLILGGHSTSNKSGDKTEDTRGDFGLQDYWVVKLNKLGKIQWEKTIGGDVIDLLWSLQQTRDGGYILGGTSYSNSSSEKTENSRGLSDYWIVKLDSLGIIEWDKTLGGADYDNLYVVQQTGDGGYILAGLSYSNTSGEKTENSRGESDYWIVKLNAGGIIEWDKTIGGNGSDLPTCLQQTKDGGYLLGGSSSSERSGEKSQNSRGLDDYWVVKIDQAGNVQWNKTIGGSDYDNLYALQLTADGGCILGGSSYSLKSGEKSQDSRGLSDYWIVKLDNRGNLQKDETIGGGGNDFLYSLEKASDGGFIIGGTSFSNISGEKTENNRGGGFSGDYWVVKLNMLGKIQWDKTIGGGDYDLLRSIKEAETDHYILGGWSASGISGDKAVDTKGSSDYWVVSLNFNKSSIARENVSMQKTQKDLSTNGFAAYPNPAKDKVNVKVDGKALISLSNESGKLIFTKTVENSGTIDVWSLPAGIYYLKNMSTGEMQKVLVAK